MNKSKKAKFLLIVMAMGAVIATVLVVLANICIKQQAVTRKIDYFYKNDASVIDRIVIENGRKDKRMLVNPKYYNYIVDYFKNYVFYSSDSDEIAYEDWAYIYNITVNGKIVRMIFFDEYCVVEGIKYTYENDSEISLKGAWDELIESMTDYDWMMSYLSQVSIDYTREQMQVVLGLPAKVESWNITEYYYYYGDYEVVIHYRDETLWDDGKGKADISVTNRKTRERTHDGCYIINEDATYSYVGKPQRYKYKMCVTSKGNGNSIVLTDDTNITYEDVINAGSKYELTEGQANGANFLTIGALTYGFQWFDGKGNWAYDGNTYKYMLSLLGKREGCNEVSEYTIFTNNPDITYDYVYANKDKTDEKTRQEFVALE